MSKTGETLTKLPPPSSHWWRRVALMMVIFLSGAIVGVVGGGFVARQQMLFMLRHPEQVPDRILPGIRSRLSLNDEQTSQVDTIVRRRHAAMEVARSKCYPELVAEFQGMCTDIAEVLSPKQRASWDELSELVKQRYLPAPPHKSDQSDN